MSIACCGKEVKRLWYEQYECGKEGDRKSVKMEEGATGRELVQYNKCSGRL